MLPGEVMLKTSHIAVIEKALDGMRFGSVQIIVHEGRIVQIEQIEKFRLTGNTGGHDTHISQPTPAREESLL